MKKLIWVVLLGLILAGCTSAPTQTPLSNPEGMGNGMGGGGMMQRHHAQIPQEYAALTSSVAADDVSLQRGGEIYATHCASCHGDGGMGDGPSGATLDPAPAAVAHSSQMMGDDYLFWRISEGGVPFSTAMPAWKDVLEVEERWDVVNYMRALGSGKALPASQMGGALNDPELRAAQQAEMLQNGVKQGVITQAEADIFDKVHTALEEYQTNHSEAIKSLGSTATEREAAILAKLVETQAITQAEADGFRPIHDRLGAAGLMP